MLMDWLIRRRTPHQTAPGLYDYLFHPEYSRGAGAFSFEPKYTLPAQPLWAPHPEFTFANAPSPIQAPQVYVSAGVHPTVSLGGSDQVPGQLATQGLYQGNNGAVPPFDTQNI